MAFDGITVAAVVQELEHTLVGGRISKIAQPENDELLLTIKGNEGQKRLYISASASLPLIYLTNENKPSPMTAPGFCMLLRKHIGGGRITAVSQPSLERIIHLDIEHLDEMGDLCRKKLIIEIMGKHSNIIFCDLNGRIIDSIKHVSAQMSSVREVLPGRLLYSGYDVEKESDDGYAGRIHFGNPCKTDDDIQSNLFQHDRYQPGHCRRDLLSCRCGLFHDGA